MAVEFLFTDQRSDVGPIGEHDPGFRLVTRSDFDGLASAMLLRSKGLIRKISFVHPGDVAAGLVELGDRDITTNVPFVKGEHMAFDHHCSRELAQADVRNRANNDKAFSSARVVYDYLGGKDEFPAIDPDIIRTAERINGGHLSRDEIENPQGWVLLSLVADPRSGFGRFKNFRISNYQLMMKLVDLCLDLPLEAILQDEDIKERVALYESSKPQVEQQIKDCTTQEGEVIIYDLSRRDVIWPGSRYRIFLHYPDAQVGIYRMRGRDSSTVVFALTKSIIPHPENFDVGLICEGFGGGGHRVAGTFQVAAEDADNVQMQLVNQLNEYIANSAQGSQQISQTTSEDA